MFKKDVGEFVSLEDMAFSIYKKHAKCETDHLLFKSYVIMWHDPLAKLILQNRSLYSN